MQHKEKSNKTSQKKNESMQGVITVTKGGFGFFMHEDREDDIYIHNNNLNTALSGDAVEVQLLPPTPRDKRASGKVVKVLERSQYEFVGELTQEKGVWMLKPDNQRVYTTFVLPHVPEDTKTGHKALVELTSWESANELPKAKLVEVIGKSGEHETEMKAILLERGFVSGFPKDVEIEAQNLLSERTVSDDEMKWREDFRDRSTFTIDPHDAKDFDDALSIKELENGNYEIGIHIADVTHFVRPDTALDREARKRGTSVYLVDRTIPMLPEAISNDLCSLNPNEDKRAFSAIFELDKNAQVKSERYAKTLIHSDARFTYKTAQDVLDNTSTTPLTPHDTKLKTLWELSKILRKQRVDAGAIEFESDEIQFELDEDGKPLKAYIKEKLNTMKLIEEFMLLANRRVAKHIADKCKGENPSESMFVYRIHDLPKSDKLAELEVFLRALGYEHLSGKDPHQIEARDLADLMRDIKGKPEEAVVQMATLRSMAKAVYSDKNIGHFSLGFKHYTHFTSPIRRYPDTIVHRILSAHLDDSPIASDEIAAYRQLAIASSQREVEAVSAERDSVKLKQVEYMHSRVGDIFEGKVTGVTKGGMFVSENTTHAEGMVRVNAIPNDWFELDEKQYALVGRKTGKRYRIGDPVRIRLKRVDLESRELDWEVVV